MLKGSDFHMNIKKFKDWFRGRCCPEEMFKKKASKHWKLQQVVSLTSLKKTKGHIQKEISSLVTYNLYFYQREQTIRKCNFLLC